MISTSGFAAILNSGNQPTSGNVGSVRNVSGMVANVGVAVGIVSPAHCGKELFPLPVSVAAILKSVGGRRREMSGNVDRVISVTDRAKNIWVEVGIASSSMIV